MKNLKFINILFINILLIGMSCNNPTNDDSENTEETQTTGKSHENLYSNTPKLDKNEKIKDHKSTDTFKDFAELENKLIEMQNPEKDLKVNILIDKLFNTLRNKNTAKLKELENICSRNIKSLDSANLFNKIVNFIKQNKSFFKKYMKETEIDENINEFNKICESTKLFDSINKKILQKFNSILIDLKNYLLFNKYEIFTKFNLIINSINNDIGNKNRLKELHYFIVSNKSIILNRLNDSKIDYLLNYLDIAIKYNIILKFNT